MATTLQSISLVRENVPSTVRARRFIALEVPGLRSISMPLLSRGKNNEAPIWDAPSGGSTVIIEDGSCEG